MTAWVYPGSTLERVVDGDTFLARTSRSFDYGFHVTTISTSVQRFRLNRAAAAPLKTDSGLGASIALTRLLEQGPFTLTSVGPYKFGDEWMAEVVLTDGRNVTDVLVADQWVAPWTGAGRQPLPPWPRAATLT